MKLWLQRPIPMMKRKLTSIDQAAMVTTLKRRNSLIALTARLPMHNNHLPVAITVLALLCSACGSLQQPQAARSLPVESRSHAEQPAHGCKCGHNDQNDPLICLFLNCVPKFSITPLYGNGRSVVGPDINTESNVPVFSSDKDLCMDAFADWINGMPLNTNLRLHAVRVAGSNVSVVFKVLETKPSARGRLASYRDFLMRS